MQVIVQPGVGEHPAHAEVRAQERHGEQHGCAAAGPFAFLPLALRLLGATALPVTRQAAVRLPEQVQIVHALPWTISPGGRPVNRSLSSAACSRTTAAA